jgi:hypothetical protein
LIEFKFWSFANECIALSLIESHVEKSTDSSFGQNK